MGTLNDFANGERFEVAFFSGPVWTVGEDPNLVKTNWTKNGSAHDFTLNAGAPEIDFHWRVASPLLRKNSSITLQRCVKATEQTGVIRFAMLTR